MVTKAEGKKNELAENAHRAWTRWMEHVLKLSVRHPDGNMTIPRAFVDRWERQMKTPYGDLSDKEKSSDLAEADRIIEVIDGVE